jgi:glycosyltransferase involved in cell wall biosynthesis
MNPLGHSITFLIPCLNEQRTLPLVLDTINRVCATTLQDRKTEVVVSDNGSTDDSVRIATAHGARVVNCAERGYGAALRFGIQNARHDVVVFADADNTYDFAEAPALITELEAHDLDLVFGSRLQGNILPGAMPVLHRRLGTPVLNFFINALHARGGAKVTDCNSGFRCFKRQAFLSWGVESSGMEFASEMLVKALRAGARISQVPITLRPDVAERVPHLQTWRDGMRHLLQIFLGSPEFFHAAGLTLIAVNWVAMIIGLMGGPFSVGFVSIFGIHTMMFALLGSCFGLELWGIGLLLASRTEAQVPSYRYILALREDLLFWYSLLFALVSLGMFTVIVLRWAHNGFAFLALEKETLAFTAFGANGLLLVSNVITAHMMKRV